jgi:hypothetical protein
LPRLPATKMRWAKTNHFLVDLVNVARTINDAYASFIVVKQLTSARSLGGHMKRLCIAPGIAPGLLMARNPSRTAPSSAVRVDLAAMSLDDVINDRQSGSSLFRRLVEIIQTEGVFRSRFGPARARGPPAGLARRALMLTR